MAKEIRLSPRIVKLINFLREIEKLQRVKRAILYTDGTPENTAEHSWHLAMFVLLLGKEINPKADLVRMLKLALTHDLVEIYAGDTPLFDDNARLSQSAREQAAAKKLFGQLPKDLGDEFQGLFEEFDAKSTPEGKVVASLDHLQPILQNLIHEGMAWKKNGLTAERHDDRKRHGLDSHEIIQLIYKAFHDEAVSRKLFAES